MSANQNDTTTALNPGAGGDSMDESLVVQSDGATLAKRPRVVMGFDDGRLIDDGHEGNVVIAMPVALAPELHDQVNEMIDLLRDIRELLMR